MNMRAFSMFRGGWASGPARSAPAPIHQKIGMLEVDLLNKSLQRTYPEQRRSQRRSLCSHIESESRTVGELMITYPNQRRAELPSAFRVSSQASSKATGSIVMVQIPITAMIINKAAVLSGLTSGTNLINFFLFFFCQIEHKPAQIRESHPTATIGTSTLDRCAMWYVK